MGKSRPALENSNTPLPRLSSGNISILRKNVGYGYEIVCPLASRFVYSLRTRVHIDGRDFLALIDTGSTVSLIEEKAVTAYMMNNYNVTLKTAGKGEGLFSCYKVNQHFDINNRTYTHEFLVVKSLNLPTMSVLMGYDLITELEFVIFARPDRKGCTKIFLEGELIPTVNSISLNANVHTSEKEKFSFAALAKDIVVPPHTALCVEFKVTGEELPEGTIIALIPTRELSDVISADSVVEVQNGFVYFYIYNITSRPATYYANTVFAQCETVCPVVMAAVSVCSNREEEIRRLIVEKTTPECLPFMRDIATIYSHLFVVSDEEPTGSTDIMPFRIETQNAPPVKLRPYRIPIAHQAEVKTQLDRMERQ